MKKILLSGIILPLIISCAPKVTSNLINYSFSESNSELDVIVLNQNEIVPENSKLIGNIKINDTGFSRNCGYNEVIEEARLAARKSGANIVALTEIKTPDIISTCYRIKANLYRNLDSKYIDRRTKKIEDQNKSRLPDDAEYAVVYFYRPRNYTGSAIGYKIRKNDDTVIGSMKNGELFEHIVVSFGEHVFWSKTEAKESITINIEKGKEYFVRCGIKMGVLVGQPEMNIVENHIGIREYKRMK